MSQRLLDDQYKNSLLSRELVVPESSFDPYLEWLGIDAQGDELDHYRLLGLDPKEDDREKILRVAKARIKLVRQQDPGEHRAEWKELLLALQTAGRCLTNRDRKSEYDQQLSSGESDSGNETTAPAQLPTSSPPPSAQATSTKTDQPVPMAIPIATPTDLSQAAKDDLQQLAETLVSPASESDPLNSSSPGQGTSPKISLENSSPKVSSFTPSVTAQQKIRRRKNTTTTIAITLATLFIIAGAGWALRGQIIPFFANRSTENKKSVNDNRASKSPSSVNQTDRKTPSKPHQASDMKPPGMKPSGMNPPGMNKPDIEPVLESTPSETPVQDPDPEADKNDPTSPAESTPTAPTKQTANETKTETENTSTPSDPTTKNMLTKEQQEKERKQVQSNLAQAFRSLKDRDRDRAAKFIAESEEIATTDSSLKQVESMKALHEANSKFWNAVKQRMAKMNSGNELIAGTTPVLVVESEADRIIIRLRGENREYSRSNLPSGLAFSLASQQLAPEAGTTKIILGAFRLVDRDGDAEAAQQLWSEAENSGEDVSIYLPLLELRDESDDAERDLMPKGTKQP